MQEVALKKVIAIDGPSGVGKSSVSKVLARRLGWTYLDTGAMYRTVTLAWLREQTQVECYDDPAWLEALDVDFQGSTILLKGEDVSEKIRGVKVTGSVSQVAANKRVRAFLTDMQRAIAGRRPCILDGRDIGTVVFPDAFFKAFLVASASERARRRWLQIGGEESGVALEQILKELETRDAADSSRETAPLRQAEDAFLVDTDHYDQDGVVRVLEEEAQRRLADFA